MEIEIQVKIHFGYIPQIFMRLMAHTQLILGQNGGLKGYVDSYLYPCKHYMGQCSKFGYL